MSGGKDFSANSLPIAGSGAKRLGQREPEGFRDWCGPSKAGNEIWVKTFAIGELLVKSERPARLMTMAIIPTRHATSLPGLVELPIRIRGGDCNRGELLQAEVWLTG